MYPIKRFGLISPMTDNEVFIVDDHNESKIIMSEIVVDNLEYESFCKILIGMNKDFEIYTQLIYTYCGY